MISLLIVDITAEADSLIAEVKDSVEGFEKHLSKSDNIVFDGIGGEWVGAHFIGSPAVNLKVLLGLEHDLLSVLKDEDHIGVAGHILA